MGEKEEQVKALRLARYARAHGKPSRSRDAVITPAVTKPITRVVTHCSQCEMYAAEVKRLKLELAKARAGNVEPVSDKERARAYRERKRRERDGRQDKD